MERLCLDCGEEFEVRHGYEKRCYTCWLEFKGRKGNPERTVYVNVRDQRLPDVHEFNALLRSIISLCHPDRHGNSEQSNAVTRTLLKWRERLRKTS